MEHYGDDLSDFYQRRQDDPEGNNAARTVRELMIEQFFLPFLVQHLRDSKCEAYTFMTNRKMSEFMHEMKISEKGGVYDLSKLTKEQYVQFRYHFVEARMYDDLWLSN